MKYSKCINCKHFKKGTPLTDCPERCWNCVKKEGYKLIMTLFEPRGDEGGVMAT